MQNYGWLEQSQYYYRYSSRVLNHKDVWFSIITNNIIKISVNIHLFCSLHTSKYVQHKTVYFCESIFHVDWQSLILKYDTYVTVLCCVRLGFSHDVIIITNMNQDTKKWHEEFTVQRVLPLPAR